jgi:hypothetical protein
MESVRVRRAQPDPLAFINMMHQLKGVGATARNGWRSRGRSGIGQGVANRGGPARSPLWLAASNDHFELMTIGALLYFEIFALKFDFTQNFYYVLNFHKYFCKKREMTTEKSIIS